MKQMIDVQNTTIKDIKKLFPKRKYFDVSREDAEGISYWLGIYNRKELNDDAEVAAYSNDGFICLKFIPYTKDEHINLIMKNYDCSKEEAEEILNTGLKQLKTNKEIWDWGVNGYPLHNGKIYFHILNRNGYYYEDISLRQYRLRRAKSDNFDVYCVW